MRASELIKMLQNLMEDHHCDPVVMLPGVFNEWTPDYEHCDECGHKVYYEIPTHKIESSRVVNVIYTDKNIGRHPYIHLTGAESEE
jgi:hypothetical protein